MLNCWNAPQAGKYIVSCEAPILIGVMLVKLEGEKHKLCNQTYRNTADLGIV